jgi:hypothetical protein
VRALFLLVSTIWLSVSTFGQSSDWASMMADPNANFYEVKAAFEAYWEGKTPEKGKGFKQFKRWEWLMEQRVGPDGRLPDGNLILNEMNKVREMAQSAPMMSEDWTYFGNLTIPGNGGGAGRINSVRNVPGSSSTWYACAPAGGVWKTTDSGTNWAMWNTDFLSAIGATDIAIHPTNPNIMYLATGDGDAADTYSIGVLKTTDGGLTWNTTGLSWTVQQNFRISRLLINPTSPDIVIAATSNGIYRTINAGSSWTQVQTGNFRDAAFKPGDPNVVYASRYGHQFHRSTNGGATWTQITSGLPTSGIVRTAIAVSPANPEIVYLLMANNFDYGFQGVYRSTNGGTSFTQMASSPNLLGWSSAGSDSGGQGWFDLAICASPTNADEIYVGGVNIWKSTNGGTSWNCIAHWFGAGGLPYVHADIHYLGFIENSSTLLVGCDGGVFRSTNNGSTFSDRSSNLEISQQYRLGTAATNENRVITGWQDNGTNLKNTNTWNQVIGGDGMECAISYTNQNIMFGSLYYGQILRSTNGGGSFSTIVNSNGSGVNSQSSWVTPYIMSPNTPTTLYIGKNLVYKSTDNGSSWTGLGSMGSGNCNALAVAKSNENYIYASKGATLYRSTNGSTFSSVSGLPGIFITYIAVDPMNENRVWVTVSGYNSGQKVYFSSNAGTSWTNVSTGLPNLPANCIVYQNGSNDRLYVGMDAGVYYRDASMSQWQLYGSTLPNTPVTELEIHYGSNKLVASTYGRGLWRINTMDPPQLDLAAVEIISPVGSYCTTTVNPIVRFGNSSGNPITSFSFNYGVSGGPILSQLWTGNLNSGQTVDISLPAMNNGTGTFTFYAQITSVNGEGIDNNPVNDYISGTYTAINAQNTVTLTLFTDCWGGEVAWDIRDAGNNIVHEGSGYGNQTTYQIPLCLSDGCYTFNVYDSYGDGMNGTAFGCSVNGNYFMTDNGTGQVLFQMSSPAYGFGTSHNFCLPAVCYEPVVRAAAPAAVAGLYSYTTASASGWGGVIGSPSVTGQAVWVNDGSGAPTLGCGTLTNGAQLNGKIAVALRGTCNFSTKALNAQNAGATALVIINNVSGAPIAMAPGADAGLVTIPVVMISQADGNLLTPYLNNNTLEMFIGNDCEPIAVEGCTNASACNYNPNAAVDDGSCTFPGCTNPNACNFNPTAGCDNGSCVLPTVNDQCSGAIPLTINGGTISVSNVGSCVNSPNPTCGNAAQIQDIWYSFLYTGGNITINASGGNIGSKRIAVYTACGGTQLACNNGTNTNVNLTCPTIQIGQTYLIQAGGNTGSTGTFNLNITSTAVNGCTDPAASNFNPCASNNTGCIYPGCTDSAACNFNSQATQNDGSCTYPGCTNPSACNFSPTAGCDNGSCVIPPSNDVCAGATALTINGNALSVSNTNSCINAANPSCGVAGQMQDIWFSFVYTGGSISISATGGTIGSKRIALYSGCGGPQLGCTTGTSAIINISCPQLAVGQTYYIQAGGNGTGTGTFLIAVNSSGITGCTDPTAFNFDPCANVSGSCIFLGCTDTGACNFNPAANANDGSCTYPGCTNPSACNFSATAGCDNGSCTFPGCNNPIACNYNPTAGCDNGSCVIPPSNDLCTGAIPLVVNGGNILVSNVNSCQNGPNPTCGGTQIQDIWFSFVHPGGNVSITTSGGTLTSKRLALWSSCGGTQLGCNLMTNAMINIGCPTLVAGQTYYIQAGGQNGLTGTFNIQVVSVAVNGCTDPIATNYNPCATNNTGCIYPGCIDPGACNFNPQSNQDNGSCVYPGCMDVSACNYDPAAGCDNGTCEFMSCNGCAGDFNNDGEVNFADLSIMLTEFGCSSACLTDLNSDGQVNFSDLSVLLSLFGGSCD